MTDKSLGTVTMSITDEAKAYIDKLTATVDKLEQVIDRGSDEKHPGVYEIDLTKKYILAFDQVLTGYEAERIKEAIKTWMEGDNAFLVIDGGVKLVKVDLPEERK